MRERFRTNTPPRMIRDLAEGVQNLNSSSTKSLTQYLVQDNIESVFDVGANVGQFVVDLRRHGYSKVILSFEPIKKTYENLSAVASRYYDWQVWQLGLGNECGSRIINVNGNSDLSSSLLNMNEMHKVLFPSSATVSREEILVSTIDKGVIHLKIKHELSLLKLDTQGFDFFILQGVSATLSRFRFCCFEVSLVSLYSGDKSLLKILILLSKFGHKVIDINRGITELNGELLPVDILTKVA